MQIFSCKTLVFLATINLTQGEESVQNRVEPPVLLSRLTTFVLATAVVVLIMLCITIRNMFPLNRPQVYFLMSAIRDNQDIQLIEMQPKDANTDRYEMAFVREYVRHRNEIFANSNAMEKKWNANDGVLRKLSSDDVYKKFTNTRAFKQIISSDIPKMDTRCSVAFHGKPMFMPAAKNEDASYRVNFRYFCKDSAGIETAKDYTIRMKIKYDEGTKIKWTDRIDNPLGIKVVEYTVLSGDGDPLDTSL